ncbi:MAG TPA: non-homologous end-joining DNA ligase [Gemmataceae bacterium]|nr:non-homologous end-joining DNA ligase [Gemmataceae bacterium]
MSLKEYTRKRHFHRTPEPAGKKAAKEGRSFVVQKHDATHLHYDFRLELEGVLKSWAVPKGPSLDPTVKRLAMHVEDHPVDYGSFEGVIPEGEYGGGTVMLWDRGQWDPVGNPHEDYRSGRLKFILHGKKLHGRWMLIRTGDRAENARDKRQWLLFKERDEEAASADDGDVLEEMPLSVSTGRSMDEIAEDRDWVWGAKAQSNGKHKPSRPRRSRAVKLPQVSSKSRPTSKASAIAYDEKKEQFAGVRLTHPHKILYPEQGFTKLDLARYYSAVAEWMLPHIANRPLVLVRCPEGRAKACFYQKHPAAGTPDTIRQIRVREEKKTEPYAVVDNVAGLISLAQIGALEVHAWGSRADKLEQPDRLIFDLDPDTSVAWKVVVQSARQVRQFLQELGLESFVKTTGGKGLHLVAPIERRHNWDEAKAFCKSVADLIVQADPLHYTTNMSKAARPGKIFIDYLRNGRGATAIVPYSTRARPGATVSAPLTWSELSLRTSSDRFTIENMPRRLASLKNDPWEGIASLRQSLAAPMRKMLTLSET